MTDNRDVLTFLRSIRAKRHELRTMQETVEEIRAMLLPSGIRYDKSKVQTSPQDKLPQVIADIEQIEKDQERMMERLRTDIRKAEQLISAMPTPEYRELLRLRYLTEGREPLTWEQVAERIGYSKDHASGKLHGKAIGEARQTWRRMLKENKPEQGHTC